jgi:hypothetical protein
VSSSGHFFCTAVSGNSRQELKTIYINLLTGCQVHVRAERRNIHQQPSNPLCVCVRACLCVKEHMLRERRSGDRISVGVRFSASVQNGSIH